jgi:hypothetical protein
MAPPKLIFVTGNANKLKEVRDILGDAFEVESVKLDLPGLQGTMEEIVKDECRRAGDVVSLFLPRDNLSNRKLRVPNLRLSPASNKCFSGGHRTELQCYGPDAWPVHV